MDIVKTCVWSLERAESSVCVPVSPVLLSIRFHCGRRVRWREGEMEGGRDGGRERWREGEMEGG